jgi:hypothetical protein
MTIDHYQIPQLILTSVQYIFFLLQNQNIVMKKEIVREAVATTPNNHININSHSILHPHHLFIPLLQPHDSISTNSRSQIDSFFLIF